MKSPIRIIHVVESFSTGVFSWIVDVVAHQVTQGHEVIIAYSQREETPKNFSVMFPAGVEFVQLDMCREIRPWRDFVSIYKLARFLRRRQANVVHLHSSKAGVVGRIAAVWARTKAAVFYTPHGLAQLRVDVSPSKRWLFSHIEQWIGRLPGQVLACSQGEYEALKPLLPSNRVLRLDNAVDCGMLRAQFGTERTFGEEVTICTLGGVRYQKAPWVFAEIARRIGSQHQGVNVNWVWIGGGEPQYIEELESAGVEVAGWLPRDKALAAANASDIYLQTSLWEGLSLSILEAQCLGLPAVVSDCDGNRDAISHEYSGFVASDLDAYVERLCELIRSPALRATFSRQARQWVDERYSLERLLRELDLIYGQALLGKVPGGAGGIADDQISKFERG